VALGNYYLEGIPDASIKPDIQRAREMYAYAASYFGDPDAQYRFARLLLDGNGGPEEHKQVARWLALAAGKGHYDRIGPFISFECFHGCTPLVPPSGEANFR
jgi:TPR repeat protein